MNLRTTILNVSKSVMEQPTLFNFGKLTRYQSGSFFGAIKDPESKRALKHAEMYYEEIRKRKTDCAQIAKNTGFREQDIKQIKDHVFVNKHNLDKGYERFDVSFHMAQSWQRLSERGGKRIQPNDIILLNHEFLESTLEKNGVDIDTAHSIAAKLYRYVV